MRLPAVMFLEYSELLNSLDSGATTKITINNRRLNRLDFENNILIPMKGDSLDEYREEYNKILLEKATGANAIVQDKYMTISVNKKNIEDARNYFARVGADLIAHFGRLGSKCLELETDERLRIFHDFYRVGEESSFHFDIKEIRKKGHSFKDYICPDSMEFEKDYFKMGDRYGRVLFLREYASYIKDSMVAELTDLNRNLMMSIDVVPVPTDEAVREAENRLLGVETNITNWQRRQNSNNNFSATVPYDMEQQKKEMKEFLDDLTTRDQRMMFAVITFVHTADSKEQLDNDTEALLTTARKHLCQFGVLKFQQVDGLNTVMPFGVRKIDTFRTLTTESLAVFIPFRVQDIFHENGIYYGQNVISKNMIIADRKQLLNGNSFILGVSGGGKSFAAKGEIENVILSSDSDVIIIDPEREYSQLVKALGGEVKQVGRGLEGRDVAAADRHVEILEDAELLEDARDVRGGLVRGHRHPAAERAQGLEPLGHAGEDEGALHQVRGVLAAVVLHDLVQAILEAGHGAEHELARAVADHPGDGLEGERGQAVIGAREVDAVGDVAARVDERAVQVEEKRRCVHAQHCSKWMWYNARMRNGQAMVEYLLVLVALLGAAAAASLLTQAIRAQEARTETLLGSGYP